MPSQAKGTKSDPKSPKAEAKAAKKEAKAGKAEAKAAKTKPEAPVVEAPKEAPAPAPPRPPADPRLKLLKKFHGKFLPRGVLRDRYNEIMKRWNSGDDHGGVTVEELKTLLDEWRGTREKPPRLPKA
jgi:hypothetical protein